MRKLPVLLVSTGVALLGAVAPAAVAGQAHAYTAVTHASDHPDTTDATGGCTRQTIFGPTWASDNLSLRFSVLPGAAANTYSVTITAHGSFDAFADPVTGACYPGDHGSVKGWVSYDVYSTHAPDRANLPSQEPSDVGQSSMVKQLFADDTAVLSNSHYSYTYNKVNGAKYTQTG